MRWSGILLALAVVAAYPVRLVACPCDCWSAEVSADAAKTPKCSCCNDSEDHQQAPTRARGCACYEYAPQTEAPDAPVLPAHLLAGFEPELLAGPAVTPVRESVRVAPRAPPAFLTPLRV